MPNSLMPLCGDNPKILILGSMPGEESLRRRQYYAYKHNRFWRIMFDCFGAEFSADYETRCTLLKENGVALWDTIASCEREDSSLDSKITNIKANDVEGFLISNPSVQTIILNGKTAERVFKKYVSLPLYRGVNVLALPSTSPANASKSYGELFEIWSGTGRFASER